MDINQYSMYYSSIVSVLINKADFVIIFSSGFLDALHHKKKLFRPQIIKQLQFSGYKQKVISSGWLITEGVSQAPLQGLWGTGNSWCLPAAAGSGESEGQSSSLTDRWSTWHWPQVSLHRNKHSCRFKHWPLISLSSDQLTQVDPGVKLSAVK